jgi:hypothetical protein
MPLFPIYNFMAWNGKKLFFLLLTYTKAFQYQSIILPICTVATAVKAMCKYCCTVIVCDSNPHRHYISAHCYQYVR